MLQVSGAFTTSAGPITAPRPQSDAGKGQVPARNADGQRERLLLELVAEVTQAPTVTAEQLLTMQSRFAKDMRAWFRGAYVLTKRFVCVRRSVLLQRWCRAGLCAERRQGSVRDADVDGACAMLVSRDALTLLMTVIMQFWDAHVLRSAFFQASEFQSASFVSWTASKHAEYDLAWKHIRSKADLDAVYSWHSPQCITER